MKNIPKLQYPDSVVTWHNTNATGLLASAIKDAVLKGELADVKHYTNNLFLEAGFDTPDGYGASLEFNTDNPLGGKYKWNMGVNIRIDV